MLRKLAISSAVVFIAGVSFALGVLYGALNRSTAPHVHLTYQLPPDFQQANSAFDSRVRSSFPVGSAVADMAAKLKLQGFVRGGWCDHVQEEHYAFRREDTFVCNIRAVVTWRQDQSDTITQIAGRYGEVGCL